jgi:glycosyltransferase involved in cell wall biosynthesis
LKKVVVAWRRADGSTCIPREKIKVIYNAIREEAPGDAPSSIRNLPKPRIISVGRLVPWKGFHELIDAVAEVRRFIPHASLAIIGDGPERAELEAYAKATLGEGYLIAGALARKDVWNSMAGADVFVLNSTYEGLSHALIEARASGVPVIATAAGGNAEVINDEYNGLLVTPSDTEELVTAIRRILTDAPLRERLQAGARKSSTEFSLDTMLDKTAAFLKRYA